MYVVKSDFKQEYLKFLRQYFFEKRMVSLEGPICHEYINDGTMPIAWGTTPRALADQIIYLDSVNHDPITIIIDSVGGSVSAAFNLYDVMTLARSPIRTVCMGLAASAASLILATGKAGNRFIFPNSESMVHLMQGRMQGDPNDLAIAMKRFTRIKDKYAELMARHTGKTVEQINSAMQHDNWMDAQETIAFGLADHIVESLEQLRLAV